MNDSSRIQGGLICAGAVLLALVFGIGLLRGAWWSVAIPVAAGLAFVLGLTFWVGWTIATIRVEPEVEPDSGVSGDSTDSSTSGTGTGSGGHGGAD